MRLNLRQLELLYYTFLYESMTEAARSLPEPISVASMSAQLQDLESVTGVLFHRRPFSPLPEGTRIFEAIKGFFEWREEEHLRHSRPGVTVLRVGALPRVVNHYLSPLLSALQVDMRALQVVVRSASEAELQTGLAHGVFDVIIGPNAAAPTDGERQHLLAGRLALLVHRRSPIRSSDKWWVQLDPRERLICPAAETSIGRAFDALQQRLRLKLPVAVATDSMQSVLAMVEAGQGVGVVLDVAGSAPPKELRIVPLADSPEVPIYAAWRLPTSEAVSKLIAILLRRARELMAGGPVPRRPRRRAQ